MSEFFRPSFDDPDSIREIESADRGPQPGRASDLAVQQRSRHLRPLRREGKARHTSAAPEVEKRTLRENGRPRPRMANMAVDRLWAEETQTSGIVQHGAERAAARHVGRITT